MVDLDMTRENVRSPHGRAGEPDDCVVPALRAAAEGLRYRTRT